MATPQQRSTAARIASDVSWACTPNRTERTAPGYKASPLSLDYWVAKTRAEGVVREQDVEKAARNAFRASQQQRSLKAAKTRAAKKAEREQQRQQRFRRSA